MFKGAEHNRENQDTGVPSAQEVAGWRTRRRDGPPRAQGRPELSIVVEEIFWGSLIRAQGKPEPNVSFSDNLLNLTWAQADCKDDANSPKSPGAVDSKPVFDPAAYPSTLDRVEVHS